MRIDIVEVENKNNKIKVVAIVIISVLLIITLSFLGIYFAKMYKGKLILDKRNNSYNKEVKIPQVIPEKHVTNSDRIKQKVNNIYNLEQKIAYLTFDDGPSQAVTTLILDVLKEEDVKATFFVLGSNVKKNPDIVKRAYDEGHYIANHGYTHNYSKIYKDENEVLEEYNKTEKQIQQAIGNSKYKSNLFRFPGGFEGGKYESIKKKAGVLLNKKGISYIDWNVLSKDAEGANTKEKILKNIKKYTKDKGNIVVLMHDSSSKILTYETLKDVINFLRNEGYVFDNFY